MTEEGTMMMQMVEPEPICVAMLRDEQFDEPQVVLVGKRDEIAAALAEYVRAARPMGFLEPIVLADGAYTLDELESLLDDADDIHFSWWEPPQGLMNPAALLEWVEANRLNLRRAHTVGRPTENVLRSL